MNENADPQWLARLGAFATFSGVFSIAVGLAGLAGLAFGVPRLRTVLPGLIAMQANTAVCLILIGVAFWLSGTSAVRSTVFSFVAKALALVVVVVGGLSTAEYLFGWNFGIDQVLFADKAAEAAITARPGLMSPVTAVVFILLATALLCLDWRPRGLWPAQIASLAGTIATMLAILDFVLGTHAAHTHVAVHTAAALFVLSIGVPCARPQWGLGRLLASAGMGGMLARRLLPVSLVIPVLIGWVRWYAELRGLYSEWGGIAVTILSMVVLLVGVSGWTAYVIDRTDTEREVNAQQLRRASVYARNLLEASVDPLVTISKDGKIMDVNEATELATGMSRRQLVGSDFSDYFTEPDQARAGYQQVFATGAVRDYPLSLCHTSGQVMDVLYNATVYRNEAGEVEGVFAAARDITQRNKAEQELRRASLYARNLLEASVDPLVTISKDGKIMDVNHATEAATGISRDRLIGTDFSTYFTEPEKARSGYERVFATGTVRDYPLSLRHTSGGIMDVLYNATVYSEPGGEVEGVFAAARDITERKHAQDALLAEQRRFRDVLDKLPVYVLLLTPDYHVAFTNTVFHERFGVPDTRRCYEFLFGRSEPCEICETYKVLKAGGPLRWQWTGPDARDYDVFDFPFTDSCGSQLILEMGIDVTERKRAEEALQHSEQRYRSLVLATSQVVWSTNAAGEVTADLPMWREFTGQTYQEIQRWGWIDVVHPEDRERTARAWTQAVENRTLYDTDYRIRRRDGEYRYAAVRGVPVFEPDGSIREWIGICTDVTERRKAEEQIRQLNEDLERRVIQRTAELEASNKELEAFTYSVSHDLRAPLRHVAGFAKMLVEEYQAKLDENAQHYIQRISEGVQRMGRLVDDLLNLARVGRTELGLQVTGLNSIVQEVIAELKPDMEARQVEWKIGTLPFVECDPALMKQVFQNLLSNALKFTRPRAQAVIEVAQQEDKDQNLIFVRDNGVGFSMKYADKLFGVFQRLHRAEDFEGTGVGLVTVQRIIAKHGGRIWAEAELDKGATFYFSLGSAELQPDKTQIAIAGAQS